MAALNPNEIDAALRELPGWAVRNGTLVKAFRHETFPEAIVFVNAVAHLAELADHHPDIDVRHSSITLSLVTHDEGGITRRDVDLARQVEDIRRKAAATE
jgi:4a-hydroxytetrahydrobiopterin dehydratase